MPDLTPDVEVMTAAAWERLYSYVGSPAWYIGTLAALEERERLLGEVDALKADRDDVQRRLDAFCTYSADCDAVAFDVAGKLGIVEKVLARTPQELAGWVNYLYACRRDLLDGLDALKSDASLGALVRRIREHPKNRDRPYPIRPFGCDSVFSIDAAGLTAFLRYLDSLLPKEPEVVTGKSGREYRFQPGFVASIEVRHRNADGVATAWEIVSRVPVMDAPVVAALMAKGGKDGE